MRLAHLFVAYLIYRLVRSAFTRSRRSRGRRPRAHHHGEAWRDDSDDAAWDRARDIDVSDDSRGASHCINPATGIPMVSGDTSGFDYGGNSFGTDSFGSDPFGTDSFTDMGSLDTTGIEHSFPDHDPFGGSSGGSFD